jgi:hypothetical protein
VNVINGAIVAETSTLTEGEPSQFRYTVACVVGERELEVEGIASREPDRAYLCVPFTARQQVQLLVEGGGADVTLSIISPGHNPATEDCA